MSTVIAAIFEAVSPGILTNKLGVVGSAMPNCQMFPTLSPTNIKEVLVVVVILEIAAPLLSSGTVDQNDRLDDAVVPDSIYSPLVVPAYSPVYGDVVPERNPSAVTVPPRALPSAVHGLVVLEPGGQAKTREPTAKYGTPPIDKALALVLACDESELITDDVQLSLVRLKLHRPVAPLKPDAYILPELLNILLVPLMPTLIDLLMELLLAPY